MIERKYRRKRRRRYRAVVIDGKKIFRTTLFLAAAGIMIGVIVSAFGGEIKTVPEPSPPPETDAVEIAAEADNAEADSAVGEDAEAESEGVENAENAENTADRLKRLAALALGFDPFVPSGAVATEVRGAEIVNSYGIIADKDASAATPEPTAEPTPEAETEESADRPDIKPINAAQNARYDDYQIRIGNETSYGIDINEMLAAPLTFDMSGEGPKVLIVHTHATEAYAPEGAQQYSRGESDRSMETSENVVAVGDEAARILNERGIETLHDTALHDYPSFNGSYADALESTEQYLSDYPSIRMVLDIHRDSVVYDDGTMAKVVTEINGKKAAQLMFVVGTDENGLYNPDWRENMKLALKLQEKIDERYPDLMRYVNLRKNRFNGHTTHGSLIIEVGTSGNSLGEAKYGIELAVECIADFLNGLR